ncbi:TetR/AcrR family transcriptional regulator [Streptomyces sp. 4F14]|uniref:TetR/AcrR family transcriptional regulator n=1 Tax=Streptomyces sp. 4F14 TaxID=3394380 RepID=UPI003A8A3DA9
MTETAKTVGRRERKKAQTRQALADAAMRLFTERGFDRVGVRDVAEEADVAVTTLFKHFPCKEALVFDRDEGLETALVDAVRHRAPGRSVLAALREHLTQTYASVGDHTPGFAAFRALVEETPALQDYRHRMRRRHEVALAAAIEQETGAPQGDVRVAALSRFAMESISLLHGREDPRRTLAEIFDLLEHGWTERPAG